MKPTLTLLNALLLAQMAALNAGETSKLTGAAEADLDDKLRQK